MSSTPDWEAVAAKGATVRLRMETACVAFLQATEEAAWAWLQGRAEDAVALQADAARPAAVQRLRRLRSHRESLVTRIRELVARHVNQDRFWAHRSDGGLRQAEAGNPYAPGDGREVAVLGPALSELRRHVEALLGRYDLSGPAPAAANRTPALWSVDMRAAIDRYARLYDILEELSRELTALRGWQVDRQPDGR